MSKEKNILLGAHMSISGGFEKSIQKAESIGCTTMQIFSKSSRSWNAKKITEKEASLFKQTLKESNLSKIMVHASYLINLGSANKDTEKKSIHALIDELSRCELLGIKYLVLHPGSHGGAGVEIGIEQIATNLDKVFSETAVKTKVLLETSAGQGSSIGNTFEQLKEIYKKVHHKSHVGFCIDTCHIFSAGYDISTPKGYEATMKHFDQVIGLENLYAIHLNDSKKDLGSGLDRHEKIGRGKLGMNCFKMIMNDSRLTEVPKILETPMDKSIEEYGEEIKILESL